MILVGIFADQEKRTVVPFYQMHLHMYEGANSSIDLTDEEDNIYLKVLSKILFLNQIISKTEKKAVQIPIDDATLKLSPAPSS